MKPENARELPAAWKEYARFFAAFGDPCRQKILLIFEPNEELCISGIAGQFELSRPAISHHLKILREAELLVCEKRGKEVFCRVNYVHCANVLRVVHQFVLEKVQGSAWNADRALDSLAQLN